MTQDNIHYLIGWVGAVLIILILALTFTRRGHHDDSDVDDEDTE